MDTTRLAQLIGELADDLAPAAVESGTGVGYLLEARRGRGRQRGVVDPGVRVSVGGDRELSDGRRGARAQVIKVTGTQEVAHESRCVGATTVGAVVGGQLAGGARLEELPQVCREMRDGDLSLEHADAMVRGVDHVRSRVGAHGYGPQGGGGLTLGVHARFDTPAQIVEKAREIVMSWPGRSAQHRPGR